MKHRSTANTPLLRLLRVLSAAERLDFAGRVINPKTGKPVTVNYLYRVATGKTMPSAEVAKAISVAATPAGKTASAVPLWSLRPDLWEQPVEHKPVVVLNAEPGQAVPVLTRPGILVISDRFGKEQRVAVAPGEELPYQVYAMDEPPEEASVTDLEEEDDGGRGV